MSKRMLPGLNSTQCCCVILPLKILMCIYSTVTLICIYSAVTDLFYCYIDLHLFWCYIDLHFIAKAPVRGSQWCRCPSGRTRLSWPSNWCQIYSGHLLQIGVKYIQVIFCKSVSRIFKSSFLTFANSHLCHGNVNRYTYIDVHMYHIFQIFNSHLFHGNVDRSKPGSVHPEEADQVCPVVHHRDVHLRTTWWTFEEKRFVRHSDVHLRTTW